MENEDKPIWSWNLNEKSEAVLSGEMDFTCVAQVRDTAMRHLAEHPGDLRLNLEKLEYIDSSGVSILIELRKVMARQGRTLLIQGASEQVLRILRLTRMHSLFGLPD